MRAKGKPCLDIDDENLIIETDVPESIDAPLDKDTVVGTETIYYKDTKTGEKQVIATVNLVSSEKVDRSGILFVLSVIGTLFKSYWFLMVIAVIVLILLIYFIVSKIHSAKSKKRKKVKHYRNL